MELQHKEQESFWNKLLLKGTEVHNNLPGWLMEWYQFTVYSIMQYNLVLRDRALYLGVIKRDFLYLFRIIRDKWSSHRLMFQQSHHKNRGLRLGPCYCCWDYLCTLSGCGTQSPAENLFDDIRQQTYCNKEDDAEPGRPAGQHLHENVVHPLVVEEGPAQKEQSSVTSVDDTKLTNSNYGT